MESICSKTDAIDKTKHASKIVGYLAFCSLPEGKGMAEASLDIPSNLFDRLARSSVSCCTIRLLMHSVIDETKLLQLLPHNWQATSGTCADDLQSRMSPTRYSRLAPANVQVALCPVSIVIDESPDCQRGQQYSNPTFRVEKSAAY